MRILALETSFFPGSIAVLDEGQGIVGRDLPRDQRTTQALIPAIEALLAEFGWVPQQLDLIAISQGPGSFTGLRVGITTAKTLAYAVDAQLMGVPTFEVLARQAAVGPGSLWTIIDAQRQEVFCQAFSATGGAWVPALGPQLVGIDTWLTRLQPGDVVTGPIVERLESHLPAGVRIEPPATRAPLAATGGSLARERFLAGERQDLWALAPTYGRPSAAEEKAAAEKNAEPTTTLPRK